MTLKEQIYRFGELDIHSAIIIQASIEHRKEKASDKESDLMKMSDKALSAVLAELDQMYDDLDRHIAASVRRQEYAEKIKATEARDAAVTQLIGR